MMLVYILIGLVLLIALLAAIAPKQFTVERQTTIRRSRADVYNYLCQFKRHNEWTPWSKRDPDLTMDYRGTDGTVGFVSAWDSQHKQVGAGEMEIAELLENERIQTKLRFFRPWKSEADGFFKLSDADGGTQVTWGFNGRSKVPFNILMLFMNMDKAGGKDFEEGLASLKAIMEKD